MIKSALVFGRAVGVWDEVGAARALGHFDVVIGIGSAVLDFPEPIDAWVSYHHLFFPDWYAKRATKGHPPAKSYWSSRHKASPRMMHPAPGFNVKFVEQEGGSSGLIAVIVALKGFLVDRVVLAGVPMSVSPQYDTGKVWTEAKHHRKPWLTAFPKLLGRVKSMSGWTQDLLGTPSANWLKGVECGETPRQRAA
jgi:hypothetical protein